jgi:hypothetical protein
MPARVYIVILSLSRYKVEWQWVRSRITTFENYFLLSQIKVGIPILLHIHLLFRRHSLYILY